MRPLTTSEHKVSDKKKKTMREKRSEIGMMADLNDHVLFKLVSVWAYAETLTRAERLVQHQLFVWR